MASKIERCIPPHTLLDILSLHLSEPLREDPSKHHVYTQGKLVAYEMAAQPMGFLYRHNADLRTLLSSLAVSAKGIATTDNGMAHFFSSIGVPTMIASSATNPALVYDHYPDIGIANVAVAQPIMHPDNTCVGCYFSPDHGFRIACRLGGCREIASGPANMFYILSQSLVQETNQEIFITEKELMNGLEELEGPEKDQTVEPRKPTIH